MSVHRKIEKGMRKPYENVAEPQASIHIPSGSKNPISCECDCNSEGRKYPAKPYKDTDKDSKYDMRKA